MGSKSRKGKHRAKPAQPPRATAAAEAPAPEPFWRNRPVLCLFVLIVVVGAGLRFYGLEVQSLGLDELWTWAMAHFPTLGEVFTKGRLAIDVHPPLFFVYHYYLQKYVGDSPTLLRMLPAVSGALSVAMIYFLGRRLYGHAEGLIAGALLAVSWCPIFYSQEARANSTVVLLAILTVYFWILLVERLGRGLRPAPAVLIGYALSALALSFIHYFGLMLVGLEALAVMVLCLHRLPAVAGVLILHYLRLRAIDAGVLAATVVCLRRLLRAAGLLLLLYLPTAVAYAVWAAFLMTVSRPSIFWRPPPSVLGMVDWLGWAFTPLPAAPWIVPPWSVVTWVALGLFAWVAVRAALDRRRRRALSLAASAPADGTEAVPPRPAPADDGAGRPATPRAGLLLAVWLVVPFVIIYVTALVWQNMYLERNLMICLGAAYLLVARGIARLPLPAAARGALAATLCLFLLSWLVSHDHYYTAQTKDQFREAVTYVAEHDRDFPSSVIVGWTCDKEFFNYWFRRAGSPRRIDFRVRKEFPQDPGLLADYVGAYRPEYVWLIRAHWPVSDSFLEFMSSNYTLVQRKELLYADAWLYRNLPPGAR